MSSRLPEKLCVGVIGAGAMGQGIAQVALMGGGDVVLLDQNSSALSLAGETILKRLARLVEKEQLTQGDFDLIKPRLKLGGGYDDLASCDVVIEAIIEDLSIKKSVLQEVENVVDATCIIATNTSSISIAALANGLRHKSRFAGLHFFNPVPLMKLVEVVRGPDTSSDTVSYMEKLGILFGRTPVVVKDGPGFLVNLGGRAYTTEALAILNENVATRAQIDAVMRECCGFRMGPFELMDLTGMDVNYPVTKIVYEGYNHDPRLRTTPFHQNLFEAGIWGRKTGQGHFTYEGGKKLDVDDGDYTPFGNVATACVLAEPNSKLEAFCSEIGLKIVQNDDGKLPVLCAPLGEDATAISMRCGADPKRVVAIDLAMDTSSRICVMTAPGADGKFRDGIAATLIQSGRKVTMIKDSTGFISQRMCVMVANLGCEMAQNGLSSPKGIDLAMRLGLNYPRGPLALGDFLGAKTSLEILLHIQALSGDSRYRPSPWLRRRAGLGVSLLVEE